MKIPSKNYKDIFIFSLSIEMYVIIAILLIIRMNKEKNHGLA